MHDTLMQPYSIWHKAAVVLSILAILSITYTSVLIQNFKTPEATIDFLKNSNAFVSIAEIIKANIRDHYPTNLESNIIELTAADTLLNTLVTPNLVERISFPLLRLRGKIAQLPLSFAQNNLVLDTTAYTKQFSDTLASFSLPSSLEDAGNKLVAAVPSQIIIINTKENPNSILVSITKTRILFENIQTILSISWVVLILALLTIILVNLRLPQRLVRGLLFIFALCGSIILLISFIIPPVVRAFSSSPDPLTGILRDNLLDGMVTYYFSLTRNVSILFILVAFGFFLVYRFLEFRQQSLRRTKKVHKRK